MSQTRICSGCDQEKPKDKMVWTYDRYGNPWKFCCTKCEPKISAQIAGWKHDFADAGEALEPGDY